MKTVRLDLPTLGFIVSTRALLGFGIGLLVSEHLPNNRRRTLAAALIAIGAATTVPAALSVARSTTGSRRQRGNSPVGQDQRLIGVTRFPRKGDDDAEEWFGGREHY